MKFFDSVRQVGEKGAFEANRLLRVQREQGAISSLQGKIHTQKDALGETAFRLLDAGAISHPELEAIRAAIEGMEAQIKEHEAAVNAIRAEQAPGSIPATPAVPAPSAAAAPAPTAPDGLTVASALDASGSPEQPHETTAAGVRTCPNCHSVVSPEAAFCPECGARLNA